MINIDYHLHSNYSNDSNIPIEEMIEGAINLGLSEICFTDHYDYANPNPQFECKLDYDEYFRHVPLLQESYGDKILLKFGVEIGLQPHITEHNTQFAKKYPFDFIIGSSHIVDGCDIGLDGKKFFEGKLQQEAYTRYFEDILHHVKNFDDFDVYGHLDYVVRYGGYEKRELDFNIFKEILVDILKTIISKGKGIEINSSGFRYGLGHAHPHIKILKLYKELGGEIITAGSDAHKPKDICGYFDKVYEILKSIGFNYIATYEKRKPKFVKI